MSHATPPKLYTTVTGDMYAYAYSLAKRRHQWCVDRGLVPAYGCHIDDALPNHIKGAIGECVFASILGLEWPTSVGTYKQQPDFSLPKGEVEVRCKLKRHHNLLVRDNDRVGTWFAQVWWQVEKRIGSLEGSCTWEEALKFPMTNDRRPDRPPCRWVTKLGPPERILELL